MNTHDTQSTFGKILLNKVPEITLFFWIIKVLCTTVGETAADFLNVNLNFGLTLTSIVTGVLFFILLFFQLRAQKYIPSLYWSTVVLISVFGTLVTDNLTDSIGVPLEVSTILFSIFLSITFFWWYKKEGTLSIHSIFTTKRECFYWLAILFTFALGTATGDLMAEGLGLGYLVTGVIVAITIVAISLAWKKGLHPILSFWIIYILTRPLGASLGDLLSQPKKYGGFELGATTTSVIFLSAILGTVIYLTVTKKDVIENEHVKDEETSTLKMSALGQLVTTLIVFLIISGIGYTWRTLFLQSTSSVSTEHILQSNTISTSATSTQKINTVIVTYPLGDVTNLKIIVQDTLNLINQNNLSGAANRIDDLEYEWDNSEALLKPKDKTTWIAVDDAIDIALRQVRAVHPDAQKCKTALEALLVVLN